MAEFRDRDRSVGSGEPLRDTNVYAKDDDARVRAGQLVHLSEIDEFEVADGQPDIVGWEIRTSGGEKVGKVEDLIVDTDAMKVRYLEAELDSDAREAAGRRHVLIPIGGARLHADDDCITLSGEAARFANIPEYRRGTLNRDYERGVLDRFRDADRSDERLADRSADRASDRTVDRTAGVGAVHAHGTDDFYATPFFDDQAFWGTRRLSRERFTGDREVSLPPDDTRSIDR